MFHLTGNTAITVSTLQNDEKPTISGVSMWDYTKKGYHKGNQVGNKYGRHVRDERGLRNKVLCNLAAAQRRDREMERRSRSNEVPTSEASQAGGPRTDERKMKNEK